MYSILMQVVILVAVVTGGYGSRTDVENLYTTLLTGYNKYVRPDTDQTKPTNVTCTMFLVSINDLDEVSGTFSAVVYLSLVWNDPRMVWTAASYGGTSNIFIPQSEVWKPSLALANPVNRIRELSPDEVFVKYHTDGTAEWVVGDFMQVSCNFDATHFPFDDQTCDISFKPWSYSKSELQLYASGSVVDLTYYNENGEWRMSGSRSVITSVGIYSVIEFKIELERRSEFFIISIFVPFIVLVVLNCLVFLLPADSGERIGYSMTCLLAIAVFLTLVSDSLPSTSKPISILAYIILFCLLLSTLICLLTILSLYFHHRSDSKPVPETLKKFVRCCGASFCCRRQHARTISVSPRENDEEKATNERGKFSSSGDSHENSKNSRFSHFSEGTNDSLTSNGKVGLESIGVLSIMSRRKVREHKNGHTGSKIKLQEVEETEPEVKWKDFAEMFDKMCFGFVLGCALLLGTIYFMLSSGSL